MDAEGGGREERDEISDVVITCHGIGYKPA